MQYKLSKDYPGIPKGEPLELEELKGQPPVYRSVNFPKFWFSKENVESSQEFEIVKDKATLIAELENKKKEIDNEIAVLQATPIIDIN